MQHKIPPIAPNARLDAALIKPHAGVTHEQPVIRPLHNPNKLIFLVLFNSISVMTQEIPPIHPDKYVFTIATTARSVIANSLDPFNLQSIHV